MPAARRTNQERTRITRGALLSAARQRFEADGYSTASLVEISEVANVTKGALYHHFPTKRALYDAVIVDIQAELSAHVHKSARKAEGAWDKFVAGWLAFIEIAPEPGIQRLMLEAPAVLGYQRWQEIDDEHNLPGIKSSLAYLHGKGELRFDATPELARVLLAISNALGTLVSQDVDPSRARHTVAEIWEHMLRSLKVPEIEESPSP